MIGIDWETYSEAGYLWGDGKWLKLPHAPSNKKSIGLVGAAAYAAHPSTEILSLEYGGRLWVPGMPPPQELFEHIRRGGLIEAHNSLFEYLIWHYVAVGKLGWPILPLDQTRCTMARAAAFGLPPALDNAAEIMGTSKKIADGKRLLGKFSTPRNPTKNDHRRRIRPEEDPIDAARLYRYNIQDGVAEAELSAAIPQLSDFELQVWQLDQHINARGVAIDETALNACIQAIEAVTEDYTQELRTITNGGVQTHGQRDRILDYVRAYGTSNPPDLTKDTVSRYVDIEQDPRCKRALEIRQLLGSESIKKVFAINHMLSPDGRLRGIFGYCGASRTGRWAGKGPQPQNLPSKGPFKPWGIKQVEEGVADLCTLSYPKLKSKYDGQVLKLVSGCLRGLFVPAPRYDLLCSDFSAIEAVCLAFLAGEQWRMDVFRGDGKIYEASAVKATGIPLEEILDYKKRTGEHHPERQKRGKVRELAGGYGGWINAWLNFGAGDFMTEEEIRQDIIKWRDESPAIVEFWGGQERKRPYQWRFDPELYGIEGTFVKAVLRPNQWHTYRMIRIAHNTATRRTYIRLPSGRDLVYHNTRLDRIKGRCGANTIYEIKYDGWVSVNGSKKWATQKTYGGKLAENITQAVARDIQAHSLLLVDKAGYRPVLHVHDEICVEIPEGWGSIEEFEAIMSTMPWWCRGWPVRAKGGWRGKRYRKD